MKTRNNASKQQILTAGYQLIATKGFSAVGLAQILKAAEVPKGSFYHYFSSKEAFGEALIHQYFADYLEQLDRTFNNEQQSAYERLLAYWQQWLTQADSCQAYKCLVVKLSAEVADLSDAMRQALLNGALQIIGRIADIIELGQQDCSIKHVDATATAQKLYYLWLGASLMAKLQQQQQPLHRAMQETIATLLP